MTSPHGLIAGRYELQERIGRGGMGDVWRALDRQSGQPVAVKLLHSRFADDPGFVTRFRREAHAAAAINHPHVVKVYDYGRSDDRYYLIEELVEGVDLARYLRTYAPLPAPQALAIAAQAAAGLAAAHSAGIVHRDVKPGNLLIRRDGVVKVSDLGLARAISTTGLSDTTQVMGTAHYMSPEQAQALELTPAADVYSLGAVLFEMLSGHPPFSGATPLAIAMKQVNEEPPAVRSLQPDVTEDINALVARALSKRPEQRFPDAAALRTAITRLPEYDPDAPIALDVPPRTTAGSARARRGWGWGTVAALLAVFMVAALLAAAAVLSERDLDRLRNRTPEPTPTIAVVIVPSLVGHTLSDARRLAAGQGLQLTAEERSDPGAPAGDIIDQTPPAGRTAPSGSIIRVIVSTGPAAVTVPQLQGMSLNDARAALSRAGLSVGRTSDVPSPPDARGRVLGQDPQPGTQAPANSSVTLFLGDGRQTPEPATATPTLTPQPGTPSPTGGTPTPAPSPGASPTRPPGTTPTPSGTAATPTRPAGSPSPRPGSPTPGGVTPSPAPPTATPGGATPSPRSGTPIPQGTAVPSATPGAGASPEATATP